MSVADMIDGARRGGSVSKWATRWLLPAERAREAAALRAGTVARPGLILRLGSARERDQLQAVEER